jgi:hypothetical protein
MIYPVYFSWSARFRKPGNNFTGVAEAQEECDVDSPLTGPARNSEHEVKAAKTIGSRRMLQKSSSMRYPALTCFRKNSSDRHSAEDIQAKFGWLFNSGSVCVKAS